MHIAGGTTLPNFATVLTDTAIDAAGDNVGANIGLDSQGTAASEAFLAAEGEVAAASAEGTVAGAGGAAAAAITSTSLSALAMAAGCP
jgi:hypothetical protein